MDLSLSEMNNKDMNVIIESIRKRFLKELKANPELYHEIDVNRVRSDNWQIERFVLDQDSEDKAFDSLMKALRWKKSFGIHERNDQYFPKEFYESNRIETFGRDREGRVIQWERNRNWVKNPDFTALDQMFIAHRMEKVDSEGSRDGWTLICDTSHTGLVNVNLEMCRFRIGLSEYYPRGMRCNLIVDLPSFLDSILKIITTSLSQNFSDCIKVIKSEQLSDFVDIDLIPVKLNGKRVENVFPDGLKPMKELPDLFLTDKQIENYYKKRKFISNLCHFQTKAIVN